MSMNLVAPHEEVLFQSSSGTYVNSVTLSKDVSQFDAIRVQAAKVDGTDWNVATCEGPVITRNGKAGAHMAFVSSQLVGTATIQIATASLLAEGTKLAIGSGFWLNTNAQTSNAGVAAAGKEDSFTSYKVFCVIGIYSGDVVAGTHEGAWSPVVVEYDQQTKDVTAYLAATSDYTADNYATVSHVEKLTAGGDTCAGYDLTVPSGTVTVSVAREDGSEGAATYAPSDGKATIYNLAPGATYSYRCMAADGSLLAGGFIRTNAGVRLLHMGKLRNARDIGGWACDGGKVRYGKVFRCADTTDASEKDADELKRLGVGTEFDLRSKQEVQTVGADSKLHAAYRILGFGSWTDTAFSDATNLNAIKEIMESVVRGEVPIVHCQYGSDRTGRIAYILETLLGVSLDDADRDYELSTCYVVRDRTAEKSKDANFASFRGALVPADGETVADKVASLIRDKRIVTYDLINAFRRAMSTGTPRDLVWTHGLAQTLSGCTSSVSASTVRDGDALSVTLTADSGRRLDTVTVTMGGTDITSTAYSSGTVTINNVTGDVAITATTAEISTSHAVTASLSHVTIDNAVTSVDNGGSYAATVTPDIGYATPTITVTMGGTDITSTAVSGTKISIALVTGDVVITATAARLSNLIPISTDASGNAYGDGGIKANTRIGSGGESDASSIRITYTDGTRESVACTGYMPIELGKRLHFENCRLLYNTDGKEVWPVYVMFYDANHQRTAPSGTEASYFAGAESLKPTTEAWDGKAIVSVNGNTYSGTFMELKSFLADPANAVITSNAKYVRICAYGLTSDARVWLTDN